MTNEIAAPQDNLTTSPWHGGCIVR